MLQDTALLTSLLDPSSLNKVLEQHPALIDAAGALISMFESMYGPRTVPKMTPAQLSRALNRQEDQYSLMNLSDEEDDMEAAGPAPANNPLPTGAFRNGITAQNPPTALNLSNSNQRTNQAPRRGAEITLEMLRHALGIANEPNNSNASSSGSSATNSNAQTTNNPSANSTNSTATTNNSTNQSSNRTENQNWTSQLRQMHSLGLLDDAVNIHALQASNGDVQAAIDLIFSGVFS